MILRNGFPIAAKTAKVDIKWNALTNEELEFADAQITFENVNTTTAGEIQQERTVLQFSPSDPIPWPDTIPTGITSVWVTPESALKDILGILYEADEHTSRVINNVN
jgi:hypothetical protein